jgi:hypothetical protein
VHGSYVGEATENRCPFVGRVGDAVRRRVLCSARYYSIYIRAVRRMR